MDGELVVGGLVSGILLGVVLRRADLCFHSMFRRVWSGRLHLIVTWALGVSVAAVGLSLVYELGGWDQLNEGLMFHPVRNILGGLLIGAGMVVALSCVSGLFYKLGAGMLGALVGLVGWGIGDHLGRDLVRRDVVPGEQVLTGPEGTLPDVLSSALPGPDVPRLLVAVVLLALVGVFLWFRGPSMSGGAWAWPAAGLALGVVTTVGWMLAGWSGAGFGPSTVGMPVNLVDGLRGDGWGGEYQIMLLLGVVAGSLLWTLRAGELWVRGEDLPRFAGLAVGGVLLGIGGRVAGGCNLGHGLSGVAQMNIGSYVAVASMAVGVGGAAVIGSWLRRQLGGRAVPAVGRDDWRSTTG